MTNTITNTLSAGLVQRTDGYYDLYLINDTDAHYKRAVLHTGAYASDEDSLLQSTVGIREKGELWPHSFMLIERIDPYERDFVIWYDFSLTPLPPETKIVRAGFSVSKGWHDKFDDPLPLVGVQGMLIPVKLTL